MESTRRADSFPCEFLVKSHLEDILKYELQFACREEIRIITDYSVTQKYE